MDEKLKKTKQRAELAMAKYEAMRNGIQERTFYDRIHRGWTLKQASTLPVYSRKNKPADREPWGEKLKRYYEEEKKRSGNVD